MNDKATQISKVKTTTTTNYNNIRERKNKK